MTVINLQQIPLPSLRPVRFTKTLATSLLPEQLFAHFADKSYAMWLDSGTSEHVDANVDIMVFTPAITVTAKGNQTQIADCMSGEHFNFESDPLLLLNSLHKKVFGFTSSESSLSFEGGLLGYFSYDLGRRFEKLPSQAERDIDLPEMAVGLYLSAIVYCRNTQQYQFVSYDENADCLYAEIEKLIGKPEEQDQIPFKLLSPWQSNMDKTQYADKFSQVHEYLLSGDCYQINLAQRFTSDYNGDEFQAYLTLRQANNAPFSAFMRLPQGAVLSISPERFLKVEEGKVQTKPIKGTRPRNLNPAIDAANANELQNATKDRAENLMIVDLLRNDLSKNCIAGSVKVPSLFAIESFPAVHHLVSTVEGELAKEKTSYHLLRDAFPGGSITGAPKIRAMEIIEELEPHRRSVYCGSIGYISANGNMDTSITIRTLVCHKDKIHCWAGGGLVADSNCDSEYQETFDKVSKILPVLE